MPRRAAWAGLQLLLLVAAVPLQTLIVQWSGNNAFQRLHAMRWLTEELGGLQQRLLRPVPWLAWARGFVRHARTALGEEEEEDAMGECAALEVLRLEEIDGHFATSVSVRSPRPPRVSFRVGQVIRHRHAGFTGVIIGWDARTRAPHDWMQRSHRGKASLREAPHYRVLVSGRDAVTYVPQDDIAVLNGVQVTHEELGVYFRAFDGAQYVARPWLRELYPHD